MYILVPVSFEEAIIHTAFKSFERLLDGRDWLHLVFVTTAKEGRVDGGRTTYELLNELIESNRPPRISIEHFPQTFGVMAHQLNYAIKQIACRESEGIFLAVYNVDSRTVPEAIDYARSRLSGDSSLVLQQYSAYSPPMERHGFRGAVLSHIAAWQTRWSLHFELGRLLVDHAVLPRPKRLWPLANCIRPLHYAIGHGLFMSVETWKQTSGFPEDEVNEDAFFGLILNAISIRLEPIPFLGISDSPSSLAVFLKQQSVWFNGPLYAYSYAAKLLRGSKPPHGSRPVAHGVFEKISALCSGSKLFMHCVYWLFGPAALIAGTAIVILENSLALTIEWVLAIVCFTYLLNVLAHRIACKMGSCSGRLGGAVAALIAYILHCCGPLLCIARVLMQTNTQAAKYKTERHS